MDISKAKAAIAASRTAVKDVIDGQIKDRSFNALKALAGVDTFLARADEQLETAVTRSAPRVKKAKKDRAAKK